MCCEWSSQHMCAQNVTYSFILSVSVCQHHTSKHASNLLAIYKGRSISLKYSCSWSHPSVWDVNECNVWTMIFYGLFACALIRVFTRAWSPFPSWIPWQLRKDLCDPVVASSLLDSCRPSRPMLAGRCGLFVGVVFCVGVVSVLLVIMLWFLVQGSRWQLNVSRVLRILRHAPHLRQTQGTRCGGVAFVGVVSVRVWVSIALLCTSVCVSGKGSL